MTDPRKDCVVLPLSRAPFPLSFFDAINGYATGGSGRCREEIEAAGARIASQDTNTFQSRVQPWMLECFGAEIAADRLERGDRFLEEALELLQSGDYPRDRIAALVDYVYGRPAGDPPQEVGGVMVTLAAYCLAHDLDMHEAAEAELARILQPEIVARIRAKQATKPTGSALPVASAPQGGGDAAKIGRLEAALHAAIKADDVLSRAVWAEGELDRIRDWLAGVAFEIPRDQVASTCIVNLSRHIPSLLSKAAADILSERRRQIEAEGWTVEHDDEHVYGEMANAASCYAAGQIVSAIPKEMHPDRGAAGYRSIWPWDHKWWKPKTYRANLVRAGALIVAEIERLDRTAAAGSAPGRAK